MILSIIAMLELFREEYFRNALAACVPE